MFRSSPSRPDDAQRHADAEAARAKAEVELLATLAASPRRSIELLRGLGFGIDHFTNDDTRAIFLAIESASYVGRADLVTISRRAMRLLIGLGLWDSTDERSFVHGGCRWGPGPLSALLSRVPFNPDLIRAAARKLLDAREGNK